MNNEQGTRNAKEQSDIKALLILIATKLGANSREIGNCLGVDDSAIRHILRGTRRKFKKRDD